MQTLEIKKISTGSGFKCHSQGRLMWCLKPGLALPIILTLFRQIIPHSSIACMRSLLGNFLINFDAINKHQGHSVYRCQSYRNGPFGALGSVLKENPNAQILSPQDCGTFSENMLYMDFKGKTVEDGECISLGNKQLKFIHAPYWHYLDTIFTYLEEKIVYFPL